DVRFRDHAGILAAHDEGAFERVGRKTPGAIDTLPEPNNAHVPLDIDKRSAVDIGDQQPQRVRPAIDGRNAGHGAITHGVSRPHGGKVASASSPNGLMPGPTASACATKACRHFTRVGIPPTPGSPGSFSMESRRAT